uniref:Uncharacterized protein n=1 Tax=Mastacembelus armatus TaxID=205130 RepID=A0A3Q3MLZ4_9TELE
MLESTHNRLSSQKRVCVCTCMYLSDDVLFSNFKSPEYIMALQMIVCMEQTCFCPWHLGSPCHGISSALCRQRRNTRLELHWWQPAGSPSLLDMKGEVSKWKFSQNTGE